MLTTFVFILVAASIVGAAIGVVIFKPRSPIMLPDSTTDDIQTDEEFADFMTELELLGSAVLAEVKQTVERGDSLPQSLADQG